MKINAEYMRTRATVIQGIGEVKGYGNANDRYPKITNR